MKLCIQYDTEMEEGLVFVEDDEDALFILHELDSRYDLTRRLQILGLRARKWIPKPWGFEAALRTL